jgi:signal peptidase I
MDMRNRQDVAQAGDKTTARAVTEFVRTLVYAGLIAVTVRTVAYEPFSIPSESMLPTLLVGDYLFVSKTTYGYSRYSLPFSAPLIPGPGRLFEGAPQRGDVAVFKTPRDNSTDFIKRIIGLPGDRIQMRDGHLVLNGVAVMRERIEDFMLMDFIGNAVGVPQYLESLPGGVSYRTLNLEDGGPNDDTAEFSVPAGHYFMMGDNRDNSQDSRIPISQGGVGFVPAENLVGRADVLFYSTDGTARLWEFWRWPFAARYHRFFRTVQ